MDRHTERKGATVPRLAISIGLLALLATAALTYYLSRRPYEPFRAQGVEVDTVSHDRSIDLTVTQAQLDAQTDVLVPLPEGRTITVKLARSMVDGCRLRLRGLGVEGKGDLYIMMHVTNEE